MPTGPVSDNRTVKCERVFEDERRLSEEVTWRE